MKRTGDVLQESRPGDTRLIGDRTQMGHGRRPIVGHWEATADKDPRQRSLITI